MTDYLPTTPASGGFAVVMLFVGIWLGDYLGRKFPTQWTALRAGLKSAGKSVRDA